MVSRNHTEEKNQAFEGKATRSEKHEAYHLIPTEADDAIARRLWLGMTKHGEGNWKQGGVEFIKQTINHLRAHISSLLQNDPNNCEDNDTDAITCNAAMLNWFRVRKPKEFLQALQELRDGLPQ